MWKRAFNWSLEEQRTEFQKLRGRERLLQAEHPMKPKLRRGGGGLVREGPLN